MRARYVADCMKKFGDHLLDFFGADPQALFVCANDIALIAKEPDHVIAVERDTGLMPNDFAGRSHQFDTGYPKRAHECLDESTASIGERSRSRAPFTGSLWLRGVGTPTVPSV